ncbi:protein FAM98B [Betta splendens]|uniref:Protein FAM98B n=1 Tax=Betta splendens TaxID=158456 RepID=A0A6P7PB99_BETSP|nr:protein FAM98B [Betta splendens]
MQRSAGTIKAIRALGYPGGSCIARCRCDELPCPLLTWLCAELRSLCPELQDPSRRGDVVLMGDLRNILTKLSSPLLTFDELGSEVLDRVTEFLVSELQAAHIMKNKESRPEVRTTEEEPEKEQRAEDQSHEPEDDDDARMAEMQAEWVLLLRALDMSTCSEFTLVLSEVESRVAQIQCTDKTKPLLSNSLSSEQWTQVEELNRRLSKDYRCRRQMMIKRFQVTLESFTWGEKTKECSEALASVPPLASLAESSRVSLSLLLAARVNRSFIDPIKAGKSTHVYKTLMGSVPDRGGRPGEIEPPMPVWENQRAKGNRSGRGGGHHQRRKKGKKD